jgi:hypothetical protein
MRAHVSAGTVLVAAVVGCLWLAAPAAAVFHPYPASTGADGACSFAESGTLDTDTGVYHHPSGSQTFSTTASEPVNGAQLRVLNCTTITVSSSATIQVEGSRLLDMLATGPVEVDGVIDVSANSDTQARGPGGGSGGDAGQTGPDGEEGGGISGWPGSGAAGDTVGQGGFSPGDASGGTCPPPQPGAGNRSGGHGGDGAYCGIDFHGGSGGGGGDAVSIFGAGEGTTGGAGGGGGGGLRIASPSTIVLSNQVLANGATGGYPEGPGADYSGYGGGGSGGAVFLNAPAVTVEGYLMANGGGGANPGYIRVATYDFSDGDAFSISPSPDVVEYAPLLTVATAGDGTGSVTTTGVETGIDCPNMCTAEYDPGTEVTLHAVPEPGTTFIGWTGACTNASGDCVVTMDQSRDVTANFDPPPMLTVTTTGAGAGSVTSDVPGIDCPSACTERYDPGTEVTLHAVPDPGAMFTGWSGACTNTSGDCVVTMDQPRGVSASFQLPPPPPLTPITPVNPGPTGQRAAAFKKCNKKSKKARMKCKKKAHLLPV